jgi:homoserine acetyltransferase
VPELEAPRPIPGKNYHRIGSFEPELGRLLAEVTLAYETWGELTRQATTPSSSSTRSPATRTAPGGPSEAYRRGRVVDEMVGPGAP